MAENAARQLLLAALARTAGGRITIREPGAVHRFGTPDDLDVDVVLRDPSAWVQVTVRGSRGLGESYMDGAWETSDLTDLVRFCIRNLDPLDRLQQRVDLVTRPLRPLSSRPRRPDKSRDRHNVRAHYDLGNDFFELFLDETMMYSCAVFEAPDTPLAEASTAKLDRLCRKLELRPADHVVEIGSGWGGFALHAASAYGCRVTTTTISERQYDYTVKRIHDAGLVDRVTVLHDDYRDLQGRFDKLVSIEMIEAVDWREYDTFFAHCDRLLEPDGLMALQAIVVADQRFDHRKNRVDFVKRHIFPGGCVPSLEAIVRSVSRVTSLRLLDVEDIGHHYAETLRRWRANFSTQREAFDRLGLGERFRRMWDFYLAFCEAGFLERQVSDVQLVLAGRDWRPAGLDLGPARW